MAKNVSVAWPLPMLPEGRELKREVVFGGPWMLDVTGGEEKGQ